MNKVKIITDGCSDIPKEWRDKYDIDVAYLTIIWNGKEVRAAVDWDLYSPKEFYDGVRKGDSIKTNQVAVEMFTELFTKYADEGRDILYVGCTSALSGSVNTGATVAKSVCEKYDNKIKILVVDPAVACGGEALLAVEAAKMAQNGDDVETIRDKIIELSKITFQVGSVDTLEFLKRAGRVKAAAAFFGNLFGIKPIIVNDGRGANVAIKKVKGRQPAVDLCIDMAVRAINAVADKVSPEEQTVYIGHADCRDTADYIAAKIRERVPVKDVCINYIGPCVGAAVGPTMFGIYAFGAKFTEN